MVCIYHSRDLDGFTSGAIVKRKYPEALLIGYDYGQELPMDKIPKGELVIMVDVSMPMDKMHELWAHSGGQFTWIDHHKSAIKDYDDFCLKSGHAFDTFLADGISACEIAWKTLFPAEQMPRSITLLGEYDTWRNQDKWRWENEILPFQYGMRQMCNSPESFPFGMVLDESYDFVRDVINKGKTILSYQAQTSALMCKRGAFEFNLSGLRMICLNSNGCNSITFDSVYDESKHDIMMPFFFDGTKWIFSLYTTKEDIDCSAIAKLRGGGGHRQAAGFEAVSFDSVFGYDYSCGVELITQERSDQAKRWSVDHDQIHEFGELAIVAAALCVSGTDARIESQIDFIENGKDCWGLVEKYSDDRIKALQVAGALIASEIDRINKSKERLKK